MRVDAMDVAEEKVVGNVNLQGARREEALGCRKAVGLGRQRRCMKSRCAVSQEQRSGWRGYEWIG
jgi:hypothetical protein